MIARHRGDLRVHSRWRPSTPAAPPTAPVAAEDEALLSRQPDQLLCEQHHLELPRASQRKPRALIALATVVAVAVIAGQQHTASAPAVPRLPSTPQQWVSQWTAAALQSPAEVCDHLYAPALSRAFKGDTGHSCSSVLHLGQEHLLPDPPRARGRARRGRRSPGGRRWAQVGLLHACSSATSAAAGKPSTSYPADQSAHARATSEPQRAALLVSVPS